MSSILVIGGNSDIGYAVAKVFAKNKYNVHLFEKEKGIFLGASGNNQNRLHLGYHYPRSYITREQSKKCFKEFVKKYPTFSPMKNHDPRQIDAQTSSTQELLKGPPLPCGCNLVILLVCE